MCSCCKAVFVLVKISFWKSLCRGSECGGFQFLLILDIRGVSFHAVVVFGLCKNLLFRSALEHYSLLQLQAGDYKKRRHYYEAVLVSRNRTSYKLIIQISVIYLLFDHELHSCGHTYILLKENRKKNRNIVDLIIWFKCKLHVLSYLLKIKGENSIWTSQFSFIPASHKLFHDFISIYGIGVVRKQLPDEEYRLTILEFRL